MTDPLKLRRMCGVCGAVKTARTCIRCKSFGRSDKASDAEYTKALAKYQASRASRAFRPSVEAVEGGRARLRGQPSARHRRGGVPYDPNALHDTFGRESDE